MNQNHHSIIEPEIVVEGTNNWVVVEQDYNNSNNTNGGDLKSPSAAQWNVVGTRSGASVMPASSTKVNGSASTSGGGSGTGSTSSSGLSELSKQLRLLQNKNHNQTIEIEKLQRQLRILSELQNVNVNDIRSALQMACRAEAYGELQNQITILQKELENMRLINTTTTTSKTTSKTAGEEITVPPIPPRLEEIQNQQKIVANLELRIGELEEIDEQRRNEIQQLYIQIQQQQNESLQYQSKYNTLQNTNEQIQLQLLQQKEEYEKKLDAAAAAAATQGGVPSEALVVVTEDSMNRRHEEEEIQKLQAAHITAMAQVREAETWANIVTDKLKLCEQQRDTIEQELVLRNAQYKARHLVYDENINDLRQQLKSLYAAYDLLSNEEKERENTTRQQLQTLLGHADAEVARQVDASIDGSSISSPITPSSLSSRNQKSSVSYPRNTSPQIHVVPPESPMIDQSSSSFSSPPMLMQQQRQPLQESAPLMSGELLIKDTRGVIKKWRKRHVKLYATVSHFHLDVAEEKGYAIQIGISSVEMYSKYPYGILIYMGKRSGLSLIVAATNDEDFQDWMTVLTYATTGTDMSNNFSNDTTDFVSSEIIPSSIPTTTTTTKSSSYRNNNYNNSHLDDQQSASDLELALQLSESEFQWSQQRHTS